MQVWKEKFWLKHRIIIFKNDVWEKKTKKRFTQGNNLRNEHLDFLILFFIWVLFFWASYLLNFFHVAHLHTQILRTMIILTNVSIYKPLQFDNFFFFHYFVKLWLIFSIYWENSLTGWFITKIYIFNKHWTEYRNYFDWKWLINLFVNWI